MKIGIDIDDTIANTFETGLKYAEAFTKNCCHRTYMDIDKKMGNIKSHRHWEAIFDWNEKELEEFLKIYYEKIMKEVTLKEEVFDVINRLYKKNKLIFITARSEKNNINIKDITKQWLEKNHIPYNQLYLGREKSEVCKENDIDIFIDDSYENCKSVQSVNTKVYLMDHATNRSIEDKDVERVYGWKDLYKKLKKYEEGKANGNN